MGALAVVVAMTIVAYSLVRALASMVAGDADAEGDSLASSSGAGAAIDCDDADDVDLCDDLGLGQGVTVTGAEVATTDASATPTTPAVPTTESDEPAYDGPPTPEHPASVFIVGDSDAGTFGPYLETLLAGTKITETVLDYEESTGLARPDFFDWPAELAETLPEVDPDIVVATFGGNDSQLLSLPQEEFEIQVGDPVANRDEWTEEYERRVGEVMDLLSEDDRRVIWVGIPNDDSPDVTERLEIQDEAAKAAAAARPDIVFIDTWARFSGRDGGWAEFVVDPRDGRGKDVRREDGFHLNENGAEILAIDIAVAVQEELRDMGARI